MIKKQSGVSLIELIIFIIVLSILGSGILIAFVVSLEKTPNINRISRATELAQGRMEFLLGQNKLNGFSTTMTDPCDGATPPDICSTPTIPVNYQIASTITDWNSNTDFKEITVTVTRTDDASTLSSIKAIVANY